MVTKKFYGNRGPQIGTLKELEIGDRLEFWGICQDLEEQVYLNIYKSRFARQMRAAVPEMRLRIVIEEGKYPSTKRLEKYLIIERKDDTK
jgi:hypothetical protein